MRQMQDDYKGMKRSMSRDKKDPKMQTQDCYGNIFSERNLMSLRAKS